MHRSASESAEEKKGVIRPSKVDSLIPVSFLAGINAGGRSLFIIHYHDLIKINKIKIKLKSATPLNVT